MNPNEYEAMASIEETHWWFKGTRRCFETLLRRAGLLAEFTARPALDAGCGTGANLKWMKMRLQSYPLWGFDVSEFAVQYSSSLNPDATIWQQDLCRASEIPPDIRPDIIVSSDVLYCIDRKAGEAGLKSLCDRLPSRGCLLLHLPACQWLYSEHDAAVKTQQRYSRGDVARLIEELGLHCELLTYRMFLLFPLVVLRRLKSILYRLSTTSAAARSELVLPNGIINWILGSIVAFENVGFSLGLKYPIGSSLIAIGRKP